MSGGGQGGARLLDHLVKEGRIEEMSEKLRENQVKESGIDPMKEVLLGSFEERRKFFWGVSRRRGSSQDLGVGGR